MKKTCKFILSLSVLCLVGIMLFGLFACESNVEGEEQLTKRKVTFDLNYQNAPAASVVEVEDGERVLKPEDPTRTDFSFVGWFLDKNTLVEEQFTTGKTKASNSPIKDITSDITFYAGWQPSLISISATFKGKLYAGDTLKGVTTTATYADNSTKVVQGDIEGVNLAIAGEYDATISYTENNVTKQCNVLITVLTKNSDPENPGPDTKPAAYTIYVNGATTGTAMQLNAASAQEGEYMASLSLKADDTVVIKGSNGDAYANYDSTCGFTGKATKAGEHVFYLKTAESNSIWVTQPIANKTYSITWQESWIGDDDAVVFAWAFGGTTKDAWYACTYEQSETACVVTAELPDDYTGAVLARFSVGTTLETVNWDNCLNQTNNLDLSVGTQLTAQTKQ